MCCRVLIHRKQHQGITVQPITDWMSIPTASFSFASNEKWRLPWLRSAARFGMKFRVLSNAFWVLLMLISLINASVFLWLRSNHLWNSIACWSDSIQSNKTQASSTSPCGHSNTSFCASHTRLSYCRPCWLHSQSNIMAVFFSSIPLYETDETILFNSEASAEFLDIKRLVNIYCWTPQWLCYVLCVTFGMVQINKHGRRTREWLIMPEVCY